MVIGASCLYRSVRFAIFFSPSLDHTKTIIRNARCKLITPFSVNLPVSYSLAVVRQRGESLRQPKLVAFAHAALCSPVLSTLAKALKMTPELYPEWMSVRRFGGGLGVARRPVRSAGVVNRYLVEVSQTERAIKRLLEVKFNLLNDCQDGSFSAERPSVEYL